jgi:uncharacterized protein (TIGR02145 family)
MENSENKSIISTGGSNLAKTEKLLSITQKILSEIKPQYESVKIGNQEWMTRNLEVDRFRNGNLIAHIKSNKEWEKAREKGQPAWCYYENDPANGKRYGKLYNWFAINDKMGLAPEGWHIPTDEEWTILADILGENIAGYKMKSDVWGEFVDEDGKIQNGNGNNLAGFNALPGGFRVNTGSFVGIRSSAFFWNATELDFYFAWERQLNYNIDYVYRLNDLKSGGASVRCIRD